jgi:hypothetical protein
MKKFFLSIMLFVLTGLTTSGEAQTTLIHYWNFNTLAGPYIHPNIPHIMPDYPSGDTAYLEYYLLPGTPATWAISGPDANNASGAQIDNVGGDTTNARNGAAAGTGIRFRNPTDSAELHWHIPSTGFSNLVVKFATQTSSVASGDSVQDYSYSVDGGKTWDSTGMTVNGAPGHTLDLTQGGNAASIYLSFSPVTVTFGSATTINNNPNLIFRIIFKGNTHPGFPVSGSNQVSGNNRFDNFTVDGTGSTPPPTAAIIHYWNLDNTPTAHIAPATPTIPAITADYSAIDKTKAKVTYYLLPGTSLTASDRYIDPYTGVDSINLHKELVPTGAAGNFSLRLRNPLDSMELRIFAPTTGFANIVFKYALQSSSNTNGDSTDWFDYSVDDGTTWKAGIPNGMKVNGRLSDTVSTLWNTYQGDVNWGLVTVDMSADATVNNNPNFVMRIRFRNGANHNSGNNRLDNMTFEGVGAVKPPSPAITIKQPGNNILVAGRHATISFDTSNSVQASKTIEYSTDGGTTWNSVGTTTGNTFDWVVPATATANGVVRVKTADGTSSISAPFVLAVIDPKTNRIIHYWDFNGLSKAYTYPNIPTFPTDFSVDPTAIGVLTHMIQAGAPNTFVPGNVDNVAGDLGNAQFGAPAGQGLRVRNPDSLVELRFKIPTTGFKNIGFSYVIEESSNISPLTRNFDYSLDGGTTWKTTGLSILSESFLDSNKYGAANVTFAGGSLAENNASLVFRIKMTGGLISGTSGNNRFDNITVTGDPTTSDVKETSPSAWNCSLYPNPARDYIEISTPSEGSKTISIMDITGRVVLQTTNDQKNILLSTANLSSGMYTVRVFDLLQNKGSVIKFVKE